MIAELIHSKKNVDSAIKNCCIYKEKQYFDLSLIHI